MTVRVRYCPSPTGNPHVGNIRTALFNWAYARHHRGTFVFRVEDTDVARDREEYYGALLEVMHWLGLDWDEGPEVGGRFGPYRQSERLGIYADIAGALRAGGYAYDCYCTTEEIAARAQAAGRPPGYDNRCRTLSAAQVAGFRAEGRVPALRFRMPDETIAWDDLVRGKVAFEPAHVPDYVLVRADGRPLYTLTNPVDDALMQMTHVLRGEDLLSSTPRQLPLHDALRSLGLTAGERPAFGHLPYVMGEGNRKLSKRDPQSSLALYRERGFLPESLLNYLALLGWAIGPDREIFTLEEMAEAFDIRDVNASSARFDPRKCEAINAVWIRRLPPEDLVVRLLPYLAGAGLIADPATEGERRMVEAAAPLVQERISTLGDGVAMLAFLFVDESRFMVAPEAAQKVLGTDAGSVLRAAMAALEPLPDWRAEPIEAALRGALVDRLGRTPRQAYAPVRVAVTGRTVSPPLYESMQLLGRERSLRRLRAALDAVSR